MRLGIRVRADRAELALAELLPILQGGAEEREVGGDVEYALYAHEGELPRLDDIRALIGDALVDVRTEPVPDGWERRWHEHLRAVRVRDLVVRLPWVDGGADDLVIDPDVFFGAGTHATTRLCLELLFDAPPGGSLCDWGAGTGVLAIAVARRGWGPVTANVPRALLLSAAELVERPAERMLVSGILVGEADEIAAAFAPLREVRRLEADGWAALELA